MQFISTGSRLWSWAQKSCTWTPRGHICSFLSTCYQKVVNINQSLLYSCIASERSSFWIGHIIIIQIFYHVGWRMGILLRLKKRRSCLTRQGLMYSTYFLLTNLIIYNFCYLKVFKPFKIFIQNVNIYILATRILDANCLTIRLSSSRPRLEIRRRIGRTRGRS